MWREWGQGQRGPSGEEEVVEVLAGAWGHQGEFGGYPGPWFLDQLCLSEAAAGAAEADEAEPEALGAQQSRRACPA